MMKPISRIAILIACVLIGSALTAPALGQDIKLEPEKPLLTAFGDRYVCDTGTNIDYVVDLASFTTAFHEPECEYMGPLKITATMTRWEDSIYRTDEPVTTTSVIECAAIVPCEAKIEMPHPTLEDGRYTLQWEWHGWWPERGKGQGGIKQVWTVCQSRLVLAGCPGDYGGYYAVRIPDV